jgi:hypothetical protein
MGAELTREMRRLINQRATFVGAGAAEVYRQRMTQQAERGELTSAQVRDWWPAELTLAAVTAAMRNPVAPTLRTSTDAADTLGAF